MTPEIRRLITVRNWNQAWADKSVGRWRRHFIDNVLMCAYKIKIIEDNLLREIPIMARGACSIREK